MHSDRPANAATVYAGIHVGIFKSTDGGRSGAP